MLSAVHIPLIKPYDLNNFQYGT